MPSRSVHYATLATHCRTVTRRAEGRSGRDTMENTTVLLGPSEPLVRERPEERAERPQRPEPPWKRRARRSLRLAVVEGATSKAAGTIVDNATAPLAIALQATS